MTDGNDDFPAQLRERLADATIPDEIRHDAFLFKFLKGETESSAIEDLEQKGALGFGGLDPDSISL